MRLPKGDALGGKLAAEPGVCLRKLDTQARIARTALVDCSGLKQKQVWHMFTAHAHRLVFTTRTCTLKEAYLGWEDLLRSYPVRKKTVACSGELRSLDAQSFCTRLLAK